MTAMINKVRSHNRWAMRMRMENRVRHVITLIANAEFGVVL